MKCGDVFDLAIRAKNLGPVPALGTHQILLHAACLRNFRCQGCVYVQSATVYKLSTSSTS